MGLVYIFFTIKEQTSGDNSNDQMNQSKLACILLCNKMSQRHRQTMKSLSELTKHHLVVEKFLRTLKHIFAR